MKVITKESKHNQNPSNRNRKWRNFIISFLIIFITFLTTAAFPVEEESLGDNEVSQRIEFVQLHLEKGSQHAKYWYYGWLGFFSLGNITQLGVYTTTEDIRSQYYLMTDDRLLYFCRAVLARRRENEMITAGGDNGEVAIVPIKYQWLGGKQPLRSFTSSAFD